MKPNLIGDTPLGIGIANSILLTALIKTLVDKGILSRAEVLSIADGVIAEMQAASAVVSVQSATTVIGKMMAEFRKDNS